MARTKIENNIAYDDVKDLFYVTFNFGKDASGKRVKNTKTFYTKKEARAALSQHEADKNKGNMVKPSSQMCNGWFDYWLGVKKYKVEETTLYGYTNIINKHFKPYFKEYKLQEIDTTIVNQYFNVKITEEGLSKNTVRKHQDLLKSILMQAVNEDKLLKNPLDKIEPIKTKKNEMNFYTVEQLKKLISIVEGDKLEIVIRLAGILGLRREEICGLKWEAVKFDDKIIVINKARTQAGSKNIEKETKNTSSYRTLHAPDDILDLLKLIKQTQESEKVFLEGNYLDQNFVVCDEDGKPTRPNYISHLFKRIIDTNQLPPIRLHDLRHTFTSIANLQGISLFDISKALGHSTTATTSGIYMHMFDQTHTNAINKVSDAMK
ncbi:MAG: site-specific integrase [Firmicutes bacterium HGW-Firmicutes-1]|jgi:integrase|nr:MAG: site-specific integrase [Firmicutes bacterium HGW-Firmicutes-1]